MLWVDISDKKHVIPARLSREAIEKHYRCVWRMVKSSCQLSSVEIQCSKDNL